MQRVFRGHLGRIAFFFTALGKHTANCFRAEREQAATEQQKLDQSMAELDMQINTQKKNVEDKETAIQATLDRINELKHKANVLAAPRAKAQHELKRANDHENNMKIQVRTALKDRHRLGEMLLAFWSQPQSDLSDKSIAEGLEHAHNILKNYETIRETKEQELDLVGVTQEVEPEDEHDDALDPSEEGNKMSPKRISWNAAIIHEVPSTIDSASEGMQDTNLRIEGVQDPNLSGTLSPSCSHSSIARVERAKSAGMQDANLRIERELRSSSKCEIDALEQLAAAVKARQRCEQVLEERISIPGESEVQDSLAVANEALVKQKEDAAAMELELHNMGMSAKMLHEEEKQLKIWFDDIDCREVARMKVAERGLKLFENIQMGISLKDGLLSRAHSGTTTSPGEDRELEDLVAVLRLQLVEDLAEAYNSATPSKDMQRILESEEFVAQLQHCHMSFKPPQSMSFVASDRVALRDAKLATFRFLYDQIQRGSGILRALDSTTLQPQDVLRLMDFSMLQGYDEEDSIFEQNSEGDEFGIVMTGHVKVLYNRRDVSNLVKGQAFCDLGLMTPGMNQIRGASFRSKVKSFVILVPYQKFADHVKIMGSRCLFACIISCLCMHEVVCSFVRLNPISFERKSINMHSAYVHADLRHQ